MSLTESLSVLDHQLLLAINELTGNSLLDSAMMLFSTKWIWLPLYAYLAFRLYTRFGLTNLLWICIAAASLVTLTDQISVHLFKEVFMRLRPCHDPVLADHLFLVTGKCGGQFGFVSSHATNVFGLAGFITVLLCQYSSWWGLMWVWASVVSFSRVYLAVHYPSDIICGGLVGAAIGIGLAVLLKRLINNKP